MCSRRKSLSCPPALNSLQLLQDPLTLTPEQLQKISNNDLEEMERFASYKVGGYMPVTLKQEFGPNKEYKIIRKLGWGTFSTVWLTKDKSKQGKFYALKILISSTMGKTAALREIEVLKRIKATDPSDIGYSRLLLYHTYFTEKSVNGRHVCVVNEAMGKSLLDLINQSNCQGLDQQGVKSIIRQVVEGLKYLQKCRVIHTDIKLENILVSVKDSYLFNMAAYVKQFDRNCISVPKSYISTLEWVYRDESGDQGNCSETDSSLESITFYDDYTLNKPSKQTQQSLLFLDPNIQIKIADFGCAIFEGRPYLSRTHPTANRALELIIESPCSFPLDMWSIGCLAFELSTGDSLFGLNNSENVGAEEWQLQSIWKVNNGISKHVALSGRKSFLFFDSEGNLKHPPKKSSKSQKIQYQLVKTYGWKEEDALIFEDFILSLVEPDPAVRATASAVLSKTWLKEKQQIHSKN
ncbi:hypothetical protein ILUMI_21779 [Ignelater luminosus]|uniref:non-specific serine/threonine protein kinase n=1 Tax=Ignelater luminosus TaxID=2038154 RepID=A0A8K0FXQ7_IGNLU|nr:hypothetical protein ILUMI_21779 [Ignelater luminosus]